MIYTLLSHRLLWCHRVNGALRRLAPNCSDIKNHFANIRGHPYPFILSTTYHKQGQTKRSFVYGTTLILSAYQIWGRFLRPKSLEICCTALAILLTGMFLSYGVCRNNLISLFAVFQIQLLFGQCLLGWFSGLISADVLPHKTQLVTSSKTEFFKRLFLLCDILEWQNTFRITSQLLIQSLHIKKNHTFHEYSFNQNYWQRMKSKCDR